MTRSANPINGAMYLFKGLRTIFNPGLRRYVMIPLLINISFFAIMGFFFFNLASEFVASVMTNIPGWLQWLESVVQILIWMGLLIFMFFTFTLFANLFSSPFNGPLSSAVEKQYTGQSLEPDTSLIEDIRQIGPTLKEEGQKMFYSITRSAPFLLLFLIPGVNLIASALWFLVSAWILALQYTDYPFSNRKIVFEEQRMKLTEKRWLIIGFGTMVALMTMIPVINFLVVPTAVAGATIMIHDHFELADKTQNDQHENQSITNSE